MAAFRASNFRILRKNTLLGFVQIETPSGMIISDVALHEKNGRYWLSMPSREYTGKDGQKAWAPYVKFVSREVGDRFMDAALPAVLDAFRQAEAAAGNSVGNQSAGLNDAMPF